MEWARQNGVDGRSLNAWARKRRTGAPSRQGSDTGRPEKQSGLVELVPAASPTERRYVIRCGPFAVEVDEQVDESFLSRVLRVLAAC